MGRPEGHKLATDDQNQGSQRHWTARHKTNVVVALSKGHCEFGAQRGLFGPTG